MRTEAPFRIDELPIPPDSRPTRKWTPQMLEMAAHVGPYRTLLICAHLGGQTVDIPKEPSINRMAAFLDAEGVTIMSRIYGGGEIAVPVARGALAEARRAPVIASIRAGRMTISEAIPILQINRSYLSWIVNHSLEGTDAAPVITLPRKIDRRQLDLFAPDAEKEAAE